MLALILDYASVIISALWALEYYLYLGERKPNFSEIYCCVKNDLVLKTHGFRSNKHPVFSIKSAELPGNFIVFLS